MLDVGCWPIADSCKGQLPPGGVPERERRADGSLPWKTLKRWEQIPLGRDTRQLLAQRQARR